MRAPMLVLAVVALTASCSPEPSGPTAPEAVDSSAMVLSRVTEAMSAVVGAQAAADPLLATVLTAVRETDVIVVRLRDGETVDAARQAWPRVEAAISAVELEPVRPAIREIAFAVDRARVALARAREATTGRFEQRYLDAQDETLVAMRAYAAAADALAQILERHWPTYLGIAEVTTEFVEERWLYRDAAEAAAAYEVAIAQHREPLARAQEEIRRFRERRDQAATAVNEASDTAAEIFRSRPTDPTPGAAW